MFYRLRFINEVRSICQPHTIELLDISDAMPKGRVASVASDIAMIPIHIFTGKRAGLNPRHAANVEITRYALSAAEVALRALRDGNPVAAEEPTLISHYLATALSSQGSETTSQVATIRSALSSVLAAAKAAMAEADAEIEVEVEDQPEVEQRDLFDLAQTAENPLCPSIGEEAADPYHAPPTLFERMLDRMGIIHGVWKIMTAGDLVRPREQAIVFGMMDGIGQSFGADIGATGEAMERVLGRPKALLCRAASRDPALLPWVKAGCQAIYDMVMAETGTATDILAALSRRRGGVRK
jgi:hypothetical protein